MNAETPKCVLLADRHHGVIEGIHGLLQTTFATVVMVTDENSLMESASRMQPIVVVADLSVASGGGFGWLGRLLEHNAASKIIVLSVHDEPTVVHRRWKPARRASSSNVPLPPICLTPWMPCSLGSATSRRRSRARVLGLASRNSERWMRKEDKGVASGE